MAPELISSLETSIPYDERIDIWSLGITMIELVERDVPHSSVHHTKVLSLIVSEPSPSFSSRIKYLSPNFVKFSRMCLIKVYYCILKLLLRELDQILSS
jgi:serine/threonine protein kinase